MLLITTSVFTALAESICSDVCNPGEVHAILSTNVKIIVISLKILSLKVKFSETHVSLYNRHIINPISFKAEDR